MSLSAPTLLTADGSGSDLTQYTTASVSPAANALLMLFVSHGSGTDENVIPTIGGGTLGLAWQLVVTEEYNSDNGRGSWFRAVTSGTPPTGTVDINFSVAQGSCQWHLLQILGADNNTPIVQSGASQFLATLSPSFDLSAVPRPSGLVLASCIRNTLTPFTEAASHTMLSSVAGHSGPTTGSDVSYDLISPSQTIAFTTASTTVKSLLGVEIAEDSDVTLESRIKDVLAEIATDIKALEDGGGGGGPAGTKVSAFPAASALGGAELIPVVQGGTSKVTTVEAVRPWNEQVLSGTYVNATVTASNVFAGFTPAANKTYLIDVLLMVQANAATTGVQTAIAGPTTGITRAAIKINSAATATTDKVDHISSLNTFQVATAGLVTPTLLYIQAIVAVGATPGAGDIRVSCKSEVAIANAVQIFPGSSMRWRVM